MSEDQLQAQLWQHIWNKHPNFRGHMWAVPNAAIGKILTPKDALQANKMKATGLLEGVWDLHIFYKNQFYIIETKFGNNKLSVDHIDKKGKKHRGQKEWGEMMVSNGAISFVYYDLQTGIDFIENIIFCRKFSTLAVWQLTVT